MARGTMPMLNFSLSENFLRQNIFYKKQGQEENFHHQIKKT